MEPRPHRARADIDMTLSLEVEQYADLGRLMDDIYAAVDPLLGGHLAGRFAYKAMKLVSLPYSSEDFDGGIIDEREKPF